MGIVMKKLLFIFFILFGVMAYGQSQNTSYEMVDNNLVKATSYVGNNLNQTGYYLIIGDDLIKHGDWKLYSNGRVVVRGRFSYGNLEWIQRPGSQRITSDEIRVHRLERKVKRLEQLIASQP